ncbi:hypothetical protein Sste5346_008548 [Sporothrix stenoceras]|uniref:SET domain-containing protein n=1 Tax=Sporothrix stenoceras TaxID=5173 RepID=A0ABR3YPQ3_9PEZI
MTTITSRLAILPFLALVGATTVPVNDIDIRTCAPRIPAPLQRHSRFTCPLTLDDVSAQARGPSSWSPWTHLPVCTEAKEPGFEKIEVKDHGENDDGEDDDDEEEEQDEDEDTPQTRFCVYTNNRHGIGGLSIVTTPETASASMGIWDESLPQPLEMAANTSLAYEIIDIPGRGKGVVAARKIKQYEAFMVDYAALVVDLRVAGGSVERNEGYRLLQAAADQVSDPQRVLGLAQTSTAARHPVENVLRSNAFHTALGAEGDEHMALFPDLARINHDCRPNAFPRFLPHSLAVNVAAARDIVPGEEITISYIPLGQTRIARQKALLRWEFVCKCPLCAASEADIEASDARLTRIDELREKVAEAVDHRYSSTRAEKKAALETIRDLFPRLYEEDLFTAYSEQYASIARLYWALGDHGQAQFYAQRSLDVLADQGFIAEADRDKVHLLMRTF